MANTSTSPAGVERRQHTRVSLETDVTFESEDNFFTGFMEDISEGGLFLTTHDLQPLGSEVEITFTLPDGHIVKAVGVVRWVRDLREETEGAPPGLGLQFRELYPEDKRAIQSFIAARAPIFYED